MNERQPRLEYRCHGNGESQSRRRTFLLYLFAIIGAIALPVILLLVVK